jgi:hypothetical protein
VAVICTGSQSPKNCGHRLLTFLVDGVSVAFDASEYEVAVPLTEEETEALVRLSLKRLRAQGVTLAQALNRVCIGDEATNVKQYNLVAPGVAIALTNIGTAWRDVLPGANGQRSLVEFTGCTEFRLVVSANLVGTGPFGFRVVRDSDLAVLYENETVALTGERELDTGFLPIPAGVNSLEVVRFQAKSAAGNDDPVVRRSTLVVR